MLLSESFNGAWEKEKKKNLVGAIKCCDTIKEFKQLWKSASIFLLIEKIQYLYKHTNVTFLIRNYTNPSINVLYKNYRPISNKENTRPRLWCIILL